MSTAVRKRTVPLPGPRRTAVIVAGLVAGLLLCTLLAAGIGAYRIPLGDTLASLGHRLGLGGHALDRVPESVLWNVRLPGWCWPCWSAARSAARAP